MDATDRYPVVVFWSDEDDSWIAVPPDLEGCSAFGETPEEALAEVKIAMELWLEATREIGRPLPRPSRVEGSPRIVAAFG
jgi:predicted RNase H-like HicB family nuclease